MKAHLRIFERLFQGGSHAEKLQRLNSGRKILFLRVIEAGVSPIAGGRLARKRRGGARR